MHSKHKAQVIAEGLGLSSKPTKAVRLTEQKSGGQCESKEPSPCSAFPSAGDPPGFSLLRHGVSQQ